MFEVEISIFKEIKADLRLNFPHGGFVIIIGEEVLGVWENRLDALKAGFEKCGDFHFFIRKL